MTGSAAGCGELLRRYRRLVGLTQEELADRSGYTADYVGKLERGARRPPEAALRRMVGVLGLGDQDLADLLAARDRAGTAAPVVAPIAGRGQELAELRRSLAGSGPAALLLRGEPGVGKTRLLDEASTLAQRGGWRVVRGGCRPRPGDPYAPVSEAVADSLRALSEADRAAAVHASGRLDLLLPELRGGDEFSAADASLVGLTVGRAVSEHERRLLFNAVADYLWAIAGEAGTLLVMDDLQWAARDALELLSVIAADGDRRHSSSAGRRLGVIGAYRDTEAQRDSPVSEFVAGLTRLPSARVLELRPLSDAESEELVLALLTPHEQQLDSVVSAIVRRAGGMPLFLVSFAEELERRVDPGAELELPWSVAQVVRQRSAALAPRAQELLGIVSIAGAPVTPELLCEVTGHSMEDVLGALAAACDTRLLTDHAGGYRFAHDVVRETVEQDLSAGWQRLWHGRLGAAIAGLPDHKRAGRPAEIAWHFQRADDPEQALAWVVRAGDDAAAVAGYAVAEDRYATATELAATVGDDDAGAEASVKLADARLRLGRYEDALVPLELAAQSYLRLGERERFLTTIARSGEMYALCGRTAEGIQRLLPVSQTLEQDNASPGSADVYAALSSLYLNLGQLQDVLESAARAVSLSAATGNLRAECTAELIRALAFRLLDRRPEEQLAYERAASSAERFGDPWLLAGALGSQGDGFVGDGDLPAGELHIRRALDIAEAAGLGAPAALTRSKLVELLIKRGLWDEARREAERAQIDSASLGRRPGHTYVLNSLARILLLVGERDDGLRHLRDALALATELNYLPGIVNASELLAWQEIRDGEPEAAVARLQPLVEARQKAGRPWYPTVYAWAHLDAGNEQHAATILAAARAQSGTSSRPESPELLLQCARLAARQGAASDAVRDLEAGLQHVRSIGLPYEQALLLEEGARLLATQGELDRARERIAQALAIYNRLGAVPDTERSNRRLEELSRTTMPSLPG
jgi:tetratricopeptide (TPR) repeat protein/transcriptional regulator with XRE-family HTH domain